MKRRFIKRIKDLNRAILIVLIAAFGAIACNDSDDYETSTTYEDMEQELFDAYMEWKFPGTELLSSRTDDGYYFLIDETNRDNTATLATNIDTCWLRYNITSRNFTGDSPNGVNLSTDYVISLQQGTFSYYTRYAPMMHNLDEEDEDYDNALDLLGRYQPIYAGDQITLYSPSTLSLGITNGSGGLGGEASLSYGESFYSVIDMVDVIENIEDYEQESIDTFIAAQSISFSKVTSEDDDSEELEIYRYENTDSNNVELDFLNLKFTDTYKYDYLLLSKNLADTDALEQSIIEQLESFTAEKIKEAYDGGAEINSLNNTMIADGETIGFSEDADIWYVGRLLDGFIFDSNIIGVTSLMFNDNDDQSVIVYNAEDDEDSYIEGWYHTIPKLKYGSWNILVISSPYAYSSTGVTGSSINTEIPPYTPMIYYIYIEPYY